MNIVMVDSDHLAGDADFPDLKLDKYGWQQFLELAENELEERCWRADIVISAATPIPRAVIDKAFKLQLVIAAGNNVDHIDLEACRDRGIVVCNVPGESGNDAHSTEVICQRVVDNINAWLAGSPLNVTS